MEVNCYLCYTMKEETLMKLRRGKRLKVCTECYDIRYAPMTKSDAHHAAKRKAEHKKKRALDITRGRKILLDFLKDKKCMDCGYSNIIALELDHRDPKDKCKAVTRLINNGVSVDRIEKEIAKCDVVCANCHAIRTAHMIGSWRLSV